MKCFTALLVCHVCAFSVSHALAGGGVDKSGVKPQVLNLPSGPGSIEGLGESFEAQLNSGTASYAVPLPMHPGRAGFAPTVALRYNGGQGNGPFGIGWKLSIPYIQRQTDKGLPVYADGEDTFINESGEELVKVSVDYYRQENESSFTRFERHGDGWRADHKNGNRSYYGEQPSAQVVDGVNIFQWFISRAVDTNGNEIRYRYNEPSAFEGSTAPADGNAYLTSITYNHGALPAQRMRVAFRYQTRAEGDRVFDYRARFPARYTQRCREIILTEAGQRVRSYQLAYADLSPLSLLSGIETFGRDPLAAPLKSVLRFEYTSFAINADITAMNAGVNPSVGLGLGDVDLVDMNGDALPDLIHTGDVHQVYLNRDGRSWGPSYNVPGGFTEIRLSETNTMLMDMDSDGFSDLFSQDPSINGYRYFRGGQGNNGWDLLPVEMANSPGFTFGDITRPIDLDNDGRTDVLFKPDFSDDIGCVFNLDGTAYSGVYTIDAPSWSDAFNFGPEATSGLKLADMNGDGLQDFVVLNGEGQIWYFPGRGVTLSSTTPERYQGWDNEPRNWPPELSGQEGYWMGDAPDALDEPDFSEVAKFRSLRLLDINGDGLTDLVYVANNRVRAWLNQGGHRFSAQPYSATQNIPDLSTGTHVRSADMNANGTVDIVWNRQTGFSDVGYPEASWVYLDLTAGARPNLLTKIHNGTGRVTSVEYKSAIEDLIHDRENGRDWQYKVPFPVNVIRRIDLFDGLGATYSQEFSYHDGYYDGLEKEFRGFGAAEQTELGDETAPDLVSAYEYDTGAETEALKGKPLVLETRDGAGDVLYREAYTWTAHKLFDAVTGDREVVFARQDSKTRTILERGVGSPVSLRWDYEYDDFGNQTTVTEYGRLDSGWDDERVTTTGYSAECPEGESRWILDRVVEKSISDESGNQAAHQKIYYDGNSTLCSLSRGNLTRQEDWVAADHYVVSVRNDHDRWGNVTAIYDPLFGLQPGHYREISYDPAYHTFPIGERIHTGSRVLSMRVGYDFGFGKVTSSTDFNGYTTVYDYDNFGRLAQISKPGDTADKPTVEYAYALNVDLGAGRTVNWVETRQRESAGGSTVDSRTFYDGLGRAVMSRAEGEEVGQIVVSDTVQFNARKMQWRKYLPYFEQGGLGFQEPTYQTPYTEHLHDALGREVKVIQPGGAFSTTAYEPLTKIVRDEEQTSPTSAHFGAATRYVEDGLQDEEDGGRLREVYEIVKLSDSGEPLGTPAEWKTSYRYDVRDNLLGYTDSQNNRKFIEYDGLNRKTFMNDPDRGHTTYTYDDAGNLIQTLDAKGQVIRYAYDGVNRSLAEYYGSATTDPDVEYHYDVSAGPVERGEFWPVMNGVSVRDLTRSILQQTGVDTAQDLNQDGSIDAADLVLAAKEGAQTNVVAAENTLGRLAWVRDQSGEEHISYDPRGRVKGIVKRIQGAEGLLRNFYSAMEYDSMDRVTRRIYPDDTYAEYQYNARGLLESVPGVIDRYDYNPAGQNAYLRLANGVATAYAYDDRLRLRRLHTVRASDDLVLQDLRYEYDGVSNIVRITDGRDSSTLEAIGDELGLAVDTARLFDATQEFQYDDLYRLTRAANDSVYGSIGYRYDRIGNMVNKGAALLQPEPLIDLGAMTHGGSAGSWNRLGREPNAPPGPHALTGTAKGADEGALLFAYDANGNLRSERGATFGWDHKDRLVTWVKGDIQAGYRHDYTDSRKRKTVTDRNATVETVVYIDKQSEVRDGQLINYVHAGNHRVARAEVSAGAQSAIQPTAFYLHDHLGSTNLALAVDGQVQEQMVNYPFGLPRLERQHSAEGKLADYGFTGKERDEESGLHYFEARYLVGYAGRFASVDPLYAELSGLGEDSFQGFLSNPQEINTYAYVHNRPLNYRDDTGLNILAVIATIAKPVIAFTVGTIEAKREGVTIKQALKMGPQEASKSQLGVGGAILEAMEGQLEKRQQYARAHNSNPNNVGVMDPGTLTTNGTIKTKRETDHGLPLSEFKKIPERQSHAQNYIKDFISKDKHNLQFRQDPGAKAIKAMMEMEKKASK